MQAAIIAAGLGERLLAEGISEPKPLVRVAGRPLIDHAITAIADAGIDRIACIVNEFTNGIEAHCRAAFPTLSFDFVRRTTPNSMESLFTLAPLLGDERFVLLTVDSIFAPATLRHFIAAAQHRPQAEVILGVTTFVDDDKPLWTRIDSSGRVVALGADAAPCQHVTAGLYVFEARVFAEIDAARRAGCTALRQFLGHLLARGCRIEAQAVGKTVDVDRVEDIRIAEDFIAAGYDENNRT